ncbi:MAG: hypothetical protein IJT41_11435 [Clostridia bacterium]|nr:hypothetical protein [Clostridia bacterium]
MDIKAKAEEIVAKIKADKNLAAKFKANPIETIEGLIGVDLPDDMTKKVVDLVKSKLTADQLGDIAGKLGGLFGK